MKDIILASASPRRREIMNRLNIPYKVIVSNVQERMNDQLSLEDRVIDLACQKAKAVFAEHQDDLVIGADTIVELDGEVLGKPHSMTEARAMIKKLTGRKHRVVTAVAMMTSEECWTVADSAYVTFSDIDDEEIERYIQTREPYDKAGGYAVQGWAGIFITHIEGSYYTIMGFPLHLVFRRLKEMGYSLGSEQ